ncbi:MAG: tRNA-dihydrouridine synthase, partial [Myxococcota bacterium]
ICTAEGGARVLRETGAAGLMLGRGAMRDPLLFERLRGRATDTPSGAERRAVSQRYLRALAHRYGALFGGDAQVLASLKAAVAAMETPDDERAFKPLRKARDVEGFLEAVEALTDQPAG